jgi:hypothetical protein
MARRTLLIAALALPISSFAQSDPTPNPPPLEISLTTTGQQHQIVLPDTQTSVFVPEIAVHLQNVSAKCVVAISLNVQFKNAEGKPDASGSSAIFRQRNGQFNCLDSGQTFTEVLHADSIDASGNPERREVTLDFVIFGDGSTWGPGEKAEQKGYLLGMFHAYKQMQSQKGNQSCN